MPIVEKIIEKTETIREIPIVTENVVEKAVVDPIDVTVGKLEALEGDDRLSFEAIKQSETILKDIKDLKARPVQFESGRGGGGGNIEVFEDGIKRGSGSAIEFGAGFDVTHDGHKARVTLDGAEPTNFTLQKVTDNGSTTTNIITVPGVQFDVNATPATNAEGLLQWNATDGTLDLGMDGGTITQQIGQEMFTKVRNEAGYETILNGQAVYISGRNGVFPTVRKAKADIDSTSRVLGIATQDITSPNFGFITTMGYIRGIKTNYTGTGIWGTTWVTGDMLYVSKTDAGVLTNVEPSVPHHSDTVGSVGIISSNQGTILVTLDRHKTLEELSDVDGTPLTTDGQFPVWHQTEGYFDFDKNINNYLLSSTASSTYVPYTGANANVNLGTTYGLTGANGTFLDYGNLGSDLAVNGTFTGSATNWTLGTGWAYGTNNVTKNADGTGTLSQTQSFSDLTREQGVGNTYAITFTISNWTVGTVTPSLGGATGTPVSANGTYTQYFTTTSVATLTFTPSNTSRFTIDTISRKQVLGNVRVGGLLSVNGGVENNKITGAFIRGKSSLYNAVNTGILQIATDALASDLTNQPGRGLILGIDSTTISTGGVAFLQNWTGASSTGAMCFNPNGGSVTVGGFASDTNMSMMALRNGNSYLKMQNTSTFGGGGGTTSRAGLLFHFAPVGYTTYVKSGIIVDSSMDSAQYARANMYFVLNGTADATNAQDTIATDTRMNIDYATGNVTIGNGTTVGTGRLTVRTALTSTSFRSGILTTTSNSDASGDSLNQYGQNNTFNYTNYTSDIGASNFYATYSQMNKIGTKSANNLVGQRSEVNILGASGTLVNATAFEGAIGNDGSANTITNSYIFKAVATVKNSTTYTNIYGLYIDKLNSTGGTLAYGIYQKDAGDKNYFAGVVGIGAVSPSAQLHILKTTEQLRLGYDALNYLSATVASDNTVTLANGTAADININCGANKTILLTQPVYNDIQFPISNGKVPAANYPNWEAFTTNTEQYAFSVDDKIQLACEEPPHGWKEGTGGSAHIHFSLKSANSSGANRYVKMELIFAVSDYNGVWTEQSAITAETTVPNGAVAKQNYLLPVGTVTLTGLHLGSQITCRVRRIAATGGTEYADDVFITQVGVHVETDTLGSRTVSGK